MGRDMSFLAIFTEKKKKKKKDKDSDDDDGK